jgi:phosphoglycerate kinase
MDELPTIDELDVDGRRVLLRLDLDVEVTTAQDGAVRRVADSASVGAALPTLEELRLRGARIVVVSHLGSPRGFDASLSMRPVADRLSSLLGAPVPLAPAVAGPHVRRLAEELAPSEVLLLENARFEAGERRNDPRLAHAFAELADVYVNDDFAGARNASASTAGVARLLPSAAGMLFAREVGALRAVVDRPQRPLAVVLGGAQLRDKIDLLHAFIASADVVCLGGPMSLAFLGAQGHAIGVRRSAPEDVESAGLAIAAALASGCRLELPVDLVVADDGVVLDIGPRTAQRFAAEVEAAATVFWNGPMGRREPGRVADGTHHAPDGTRHIARAMANAPAMTVVAGRQTIGSLESLGLRGHVSHVSAGGAATFEFLEGRELPGIRALMRTPVAAL